MKKYSLITTSYCLNCIKPSKEELSNKFNYDGELSDIYVNFSNTFSPFNFELIPNVGITKRKDLVYGKIFLLKKFIEDNILGNYEYLCHIDYSDTKFNGSFVEMMQKFISEKKDFLISTEKIAWPYISQLKIWTNRDLLEPEFTYLNSGAIISKTNIFYDYLIKMENLCLESNIDFWDDQGVWQYYDLMVENLNKDTISEFFFSTALLDETYYTIENNKIKNKFGVYPYLIHDNSSFSLNLTKKI
jgi:hypothetical protein